MKWTAMRRCRSCIIAIWCDDSRLTWFLVRFTIWRNTICIVILRARDVICFIWGMKSQISYPDWGVCTSVLGDTISGCMEAWKDLRAVCRVGESVFRNVLPYMHCIADRSKRWNRPFLTPTASAVRCFNCEEGLLTIEYARRLLNGDKLIRWWNSDTGTSTPRGASACSLRVVAEI